MRRLAASTVCVFLLLFAQFGALGHALWHASGHAAAYGTTQPATRAAGHTHDNLAHGDEQPSGQASLCAFDLAFGQVLGGVHGSAPPALPMVTVDVAIPDVPASRLRAESLSPKSRGPPVFL